MPGGSILLGEDRDRPHLQLTGGAHDADGDLAAIGDEKARDLLAHDPVLIYASATSILSPSAPITIAKIPLERALGRAVREPRAEGRQHHAPDGEPDQRRNVDVADAVRRESGGAPPVDQIADRSHHRDREADGRGRADRRVKRHVAEDQERNRQGGAAHGRQRRADADPGADEQKPRRSRQLARRLGLPVEEHARGHVEHARPRRSPPAGRSGCGAPAGFRGRCR